MCLLPENYVHFSNLPSYIRIRMDYDWFFESEWLKYENFGQSGIWTHDLRVITPALSLLSWSGLGCNSISVNQYFRDVSSTSLVVCKDWTATPLRSRFQNTSRNQSFIPSLGTLVNRIDPREYGYMTWSSKSAFAVRCRACARLHWLHKLLSWGAFELLA